MTALFFGGLFLIGGAAALAQREPISTTPDAPQQPIVLPDGGKQDRPKRIREGTLFQNKRGFFRTVGGRTMLYSLDESEDYICLENLHLERILNAIAERPGRNVWSIDGEYTEFRGENYVLIRRAILSPSGVELPNGRKQENVIPDPRPE